VQPSRALGIIALSAVVVAAISFAAVDVIIAGGKPDVAIPPEVLIYAAVGTVALLASIVPAFIWFVSTLRQPHHDFDLEPAPVAASALPHYEQDDL
jgi:hypothetical protein